MPPDDTVPPGGDWEFPPIEPAEGPVPPARPVRQVLPTSPTIAARLPGATRPPPPAPVADAVPDEPVADEADEPVPDEAVTDEPVADEVADEPVPDETVADEPLADDPVVAGSIAADAPAGDEEVPAAVEEPPSTGVLPVPRRTSVPGGPVSPVRALAGAAVAVAGVLLGIGALLWATDAPKGSPALQQTQAQSSDLSPTPSASPSPSPSPSPEPTTVLPAPLASPTAVPSPATAPKIALTVLNNSNVNHLAARAAAKYHAAGWPIKDTGSFRGRIPVTTVYYAPGQQASAELLQKEFPAIQRVRPRFSTLPGSGLTVVLTRDYPA